MNSKDFIFWLKGFVTACHHHMPTPPQWDLLKDELNKVDSVDLPSTPWQPTWYPNGTVTLPNYSTGVLTTGGRTDVTTTPPQMWTTTSTVNANITYTNGDRKHLIDFEDDDEKIF